MTSRTQDAPGKTRTVREIDLVKGRQQVQDLPEVLDDRVGTVFLGERHGVLFLGRFKDDVAADAGLLGAGDVPLDIVRHGHAVLGSHTQVGTGDLVDLGAGLAQVADRGEDDRVEILGQAVLLQPVGDLVLTDEVGDDAQLVAALMQAFDDLHAAVHDNAAALALAVLEAQLMADLLDAGLVIVRQQPFAP